MGEMVPKPNNVVCNSLIFFKKKRKEDGRDSARKGEYKNKERKGKNV